MSDNRDWPVEFRYVDKVQPIDGDIGQTVRVLQVRYRDDNTGVYFVAKDNRYTQWQDVPVVTI